MTLNEQIQDILRDVKCDTGNWGECGGQNKESRIDAAKELELLFLQSRLDLLDEISEMIDHSDYPKTGLKNIRAELKQQINNLTK